LGDGESLTQLATDAARKARWPRSRTTRGSHSGASAPGAAPFAPP
jgi:hypothetical protein